MMSSISFADSQVIMRDSLHKIVHIESGKLKPDADNVVLSRYFYSKYFYFEGI